VACHRGSIVAGSYGWLKEDSSSQRATAKGRKPGSPASNPGTDAARWSAVVRFPRLGFRNSSV